MESLFFDNWQTLQRTVVIGILAYLSLLVLLRVSGQRTLAKMNAFDLVVTVSLGSTLATILLNKNVTLAEGTLALALLIGMQFAVTWSSVRAAWFRKLVTGEPTLLFFHGHYLIILEFICDANFTYAPIRSINLTDSPSRNCETSCLPPSSNAL